LWVNFRILAEEFKTRHVKLVEMLAVCCKTNANYSIKNDEKQNKIGFDTLKIFLKFPVIKANVMNYI